DAVLKDGALLPYGGIKGGSLAFMIEVLATLGGARFGFEDNSSKIPGAVTSNAGQFLLLIDPRRFGDGFLDRIEALIDQLRDAGTGRLARRPAPPGPPTPRARRHRRFTGDARVPREEGPTCRRSM